MKDTTGNKRFYHPDHLGSTNMVTNQNGNAIENSTYYPYGRTYTGGNSRFLYTGKERDDNNLYYYGARYYSPDKLRRFIQPDSIIQDVYNPQDLNRYAYVRNNPYKYVDPEGKQAIETVIVVTGVSLFISEIYGILYSAQSDYLKQAIIDIQSVSTKNPNTALGTFNERVANQIAGQSKAGAKLSLATIRAGFSSSASTLSASDIEYIKSTINPALSKLDIKDPNSLKGSEVLNLLEEKNEKFRQDEKFRKIQTKIERYEKTSQKKIERRK